MYGKFGLVPITAYTCTVHISLVGQKKEDYQNIFFKRVTALILKLSYDQKPETSFGLMVHFLKHYRVGMEVRFQCCIFPF